MQFYTFVTFSPVNLMIFYINLEYSTNALRGTWHE